MVCVANGQTSDAYRNDYFSGDGPTTVVAGSAAERIPMIPLIVASHAWQVMDANTGVYSTRCALQVSCMGLYPRYASLTRNGLGAWFASRTVLQRTVGLSTARLDRRGGCQVDGFMHPNYSAGWERLLQSPVSWAVEHGAHYCWVRVSAEDEDKISCFEAIGFHAVRQDRGALDAPFNVNGKQIEAIRLQRSL
jgi:hypothetical protein